MAIESDCPQVVLLAVIERAVQDWRWLRRRQKGWIRSYGQGVGTLELREFFDSADFEGMCDLADLDPGCVRAAARLDC